MITNEQLNLYIENTINQRNYLTFAKLLGIRDFSMYKRIIELLYENRISTFDIEELDIIDNTSIRIFLDSYDLRTLPAILNSSNLTSIFDTKSYLDGSTTGNTKLVGLISERNILETSGMPERLISQPFRVTLNKETPVAYSNITEVNLRFTSDVLPNIKQDLGLNNLQDIRSLFPLYTDLGLPINAWKSIVEGYYNSIMLDILPYLEDNRLCFLMIDVDDEYSFLSLATSIFHGISNYEKVGSIVKQLKTISSFEIAALNRPYNSSEIISIRNFLTVATPHPSSVTEDLSNIRYKASLVSIAESYLALPNDIDELLTSLDIINGILLRFKPLVASIEKWTSNTMRSTQLM